MYVCSCVRVFVCLCVRVECVAVHISVVGGVSDVILFRSPLWGSRHYAQQNFNEIVCSCGVWRSIKCAQVRYFIAVALSGLFCNIHTNIVKL